MKTRIITGSIFALIMAGFLLPGYKFPALPLLLFFLVNIFGGREVYRVVIAKFNLSLRGLSLLWSVIFLTALIPCGGNTLIDRSLAQLGIFAICALTLLFFSTIILACIHGTSALTPAVAVNSAGLYTAFPCAVAVVLLTAVPDGFYWLLIAVFSPWVSDVSAYFTGFYLGKRKLIPQISPKKTVAGFIGGLVGTMIVMAVAYKFMVAALYGSGSDSPYYTIIIGSFIGAILSIASQFGDWLASVIKRETGVKDFGTLLPGHGGIMDRFDSVMFTLPATLLIVLLLAAIK
ncbi:phosphatidate cytidylyltransferase [Mageeibacillus indolicus]|uniref:Phosphatidate cytidylyltransferase n=1 Tax=Mageeibacillus indolicus (strain UPII9-5) TaxID=699246 RepID=D3R240_MAGIU|nr:phosphatidate cytidylyltransferase [Mageeibacillus indolicus]ADC90526.1 phosphatidate cytidylyltransferase [Mageeibacillus indolicus UPII9-5]